MCMNKISTVTGRIKSQWMSVPFPKLQKGKEGWEGGGEEEGEGQGRGRVERGREGGERKGKKRGGEDRVREGGRKRGRKRGRITIEYLLGR